MDENAANGGICAEDRALRGYSWRPTSELEPGMVIARPIVGTAGRRATIHIAVGNAITANTIAQLVNKGVECVAIVDAAEADPDAHARALRRYETRLGEIFGPAPDESCRALYAALFADGPG